MFCLLLKLDVLKASTPKMKLKVQMIYVHARVEILYIAIDDCKCVKCIFL